MKLSSLKRAKKVDIKKFGLAIIFATSASCMMQARETIANTQAQQPHVPELELQRSIEQSINDKNDKRTFAEFVDYWIIIIRNNFSYFCEKYGTDKVKNLLKILLNIRNSKDANVILTALRDYQTLLPESLSKNPWKTLDGLRNRLRK